MENKCPFCGSELPEEASFCLVCFTTLNPPVDTTENNKKPFLLLLKTHSKKLCSGAAALLASLLIMGICIAAMKNTNSAPKPLKNDTTIIVEETYYVPVTEENGVAVTNESGEQVTDVVEVTKIETLPPSTTEEQGFFDKIFSSPTSKNDKNNNSDKTNETTEKKGFFDQIVDSVFGNGEKETTAPSASTTTEEHGTTERPSSTTEPSTTTPHSATTAPATTEKPTQTTTTGTTAMPTTQTTKAPASTDSSADFTYTEVEGKIKLTSYVGNASNVVVPSTIAGKNVTYLSENLFSNNSNIKTITFLGRTTEKGYFYLPHNTVVFNNLPNLTTVTFPFETYNYFINSNGNKVTSDFTFDVLFTNCPKISAVNMGEKINTSYSNSLYRMRSFDGVVFTHTDSYPNCRLIWYPRAKTTANYTVPDTSYHIYKDAIINNPYLESVTFSKIMQTVHNSNFYNCTKLKSFSVPSGNSTFSSEDGVVYVKGFLVNGVQYHGCIYPPAKTDSYFEFSSNYNAYVGATCFRNNPYLKTIKLPPTSRLDGNIITKKPPALEKLILPQNIGNAPSNLKNHFTVEYY